MVASSELGKNKLLNVLFWIIYFIAIVLSEKSYYSGYYETIFTNSGKFAMMIVCYYLLMHLLIPLFHKKKYVTLLLFSILSIYFVSVFNIFWRVFFLQKYFPESYPSTHHYEFTWAYINRLDWIFGFYIVYYFRPSLLIAFYRYVINQRRIFKIENEKTALELQALKNQLSPHFLFNTMNNVYFLALENEKKTPDLILKLSQILRYIVYNGQEKFVPLALEMEQIENLIEIESLRHNPEDISITYNTVVDDDQVQIAPLILLSYVENALKHGLGDKTEDGIIHIQLNADQEYISFNIVNSIPNKSNVTLNEDFQIGIKNLKQQLKILYKNEHTLYAEETDNQYEVRLNLKSK